MIEDVMRERLEMIMEVVVGGRMTGQKIDVEIGEMEKDGANEILMDNNEMW